MCVFGIVCAEMIDLLLFGSATAVWIVAVVIIICVCTWKSVLKPLLGCIVVHCGMSSKQPERMRYAAYNYTGNSSTLSVIFHASLRLGINWVMHGQVRSNCHDNTYVQYYGVSLIEGCSCC